MINLKRVLAPVDDIQFEEICSFETENYIGIFIDPQGEFVILPKNEEFMIASIGLPQTLQEMDEATYQETGERIIGVSTSRVLEVKIDYGET